MYLDSIHQSRPFPCPTKSTFSPHTSLSPTLIGELLALFRFYPFTAASSPLPPVKNLVPKAPQEPKILFPKNPTTKGQYSDKLNTEKTFPPGPTTSVQEFYNFLTHYRKQCLSPERKQCIKTTTQH